MSIFLLQLLFLQHLVDLPGNHLQQILYAYSVLGPPLQHSLHYFLDFREAVLCQYHFILVDELVYALEVGSLVEEVVEYHTHVPH